MRRATECGCRVWKSQRHHTLPSFVRRLPPSFLGVSSSGFTGNPYKILGVSRQATDEEIKSAYKAQALKWHPDTSGLSPEESREHFQTVASAYRSLSDPDSPWCRNRPAGRRSGGPMLRNEPVDDRGEGGPERAAEWFQQFMKHKEANVSRIQRAWEKSRGSPPAGAEANRPKDHADKRVSWAERELGAGYKETEEVTVRVERGIQIHTTDTHVRTPSGVTERLMMESWIGDTAKPRQRTVLNSLSPATRLARKLYGSSEALEREERFEAVSIFGVIAVAKAEFSKLTRRLDNAT